MLGAGNSPAGMDTLPIPCPPSSHMSSLSRDRDHLSKNLYSQSPGTRPTLTLKNTVVLEDVGETWATWSITLDRLLMTNSYMATSYSANVGQGFHKQFSSARVRKSALLLLATNQYTAFPGDAIPPMLSAIAIYTGRGGRGGSWGPGLVSKGDIDLKRWSKSLAKQNFICKTSEHTLPMNF